MKRMKKMENGDHVRDFTKRIDRCHTYRGVHIPGCWGCVIYGHSRCTCRTPKREDLIAKMNMLERRIAELEGKL